MSNPSMADIENYRAEAQQNGRTLWLERNVYYAISGFPGGQEWIEKNIDVSHSLKEETGDTTSPSIHCWEHRQKVNRN